MLQTLINVFRIAELRNKILFTLAMLAVYRIGHWIPLPGINQEQLKKFFESQDAGSAVKKATDFISLFSGGAFGHSTNFRAGRDAVHLGGHYFPADLVDPGEPAQEAPGGRPDGSSEDY